MVLATGFTTFGIVRKRLADIYGDFALRIKESGVFGTQTTVDAPDTFPSDPLVQIMVTTGASIHEVWEAVELWYTQLDPATASGAYLEHLHGSRLGILRAPGQTDTEYRATLLNALVRPNRNNLLTVLDARTDVECAALLTSTVDNPIEGIPAPGNAIVVKGCNLDYAAMAGDLYNSVELGLHQFYGDKIGSHMPAAGGCVTYRFMEAEPLYVALEVHGYYTEVCGTNGASTVQAAVLAAMQRAFPSCRIGEGLNTATAMTAIGVLSGFVVTGVSMARRARQLWGNGCDPADAPKVTICGTETAWVSSITCGTNPGEVWCPPAPGCLDIKPWEYVALDAQFITVVEDPTKGGCT